MSYRRQKTARHSRECGQALVFLVLALSVVLLGAGALCVDMSNLWFHRQAAQNAADAACTAGAMDLLVDAQGGATGHQGFVNGTAFNCSAGSTAAPCQYAAKNGYNSNTGNLVSVSFPDTVTGVPTGTVPPASLAPTSFMRVDVTDNVQTFFSGMLSGNRTQTVRAFAACGVVLAKAPIPILVLDPHNPVTTPPSKALDIQGTPTINIVGGPSQSIQVNSDAATAVNVGGSATINLTTGGPNFDGSNLGTYGGPATAPAGFVTANSGKWVKPSSPIADPFAQIDAPAQPPPPADLVSAPVCSSPTIQSGSCNVAHLVHGCPDTNGCTLFTGGYYPNGICIGTGGCGGGIAHASKNTAIFDPGLYYVNHGIQLMAHAMVRPGNGVGDGSGGTIFYLTGASNTCSGQPGLICVGSNSGSEAIDPFDTSAVQCPGGAAPDPQLNLPATLPGNVLLAPCTGPYGDPLGNYRGILFFQDRASGAGGGWGGGGGFLLAGSMYFHHCNAAGTGASCGANPTYYNSIFTLQGNSGSASYVLGDIITDNLAMGGTPTINMALNPTAAYDTLKATLLR
ncbi:MAG: pilus assembly protein TadG-related protein [Terriglobales bacterium]